MNFVSRRDTAPQGTPSGVTDLLTGGYVPSAGRCWARMTPGRLTFFSFHPEAPPGISMCRVCNHLVLRGLGRWWQ